MKDIAPPLTNVQLEILKAFSFNLNQEELKDFRALIAQYFAQRAIKTANEAWDKNEWNDNKVDEILQTKMRKL